MDPTECIDMKIVMVGDIGAGKTCLTTQFIRNQYNDSTQPTIGASYMWKEALIDGRKVKFSLWDTAGQEQYHSLVPIYFRSAAAVVLLYDITNANSLAGTKNWETQIRSNAPQDTIIALAGNKLDLESAREVSLEDAQNVKQQYGTDLLFECSAKTSEGVAELFEAIAKEHLKRVAAEQGRQRAPTFVPDANLGPPRQRDCRC